MIITKEVHEKKFYKNYWLFFFVFLCRISIKRILKIGKNYKKFQSWPKQFGDDVKILVKGVTYKGFKFWVLE